MKKVKAEAFDLMQYLYKTAHEPLIHGVLCLAGHVDETVLQRAVTLSSKAVPPVLMRFKMRRSRPVWEDAGHTGGDAVKLISPEEPETVLRLLAGLIDVSRGPQLKIHIVRNPARDVLVIIMNHMVCDGAGFKEYLYLLARLYTACARGEDVQVSTAPRGASQLFYGFGPARKRAIFFSKYDLSKQKNHPGYPLKGNQTRPVFVTRTIGEQDLLEIKQSAKKLNATVNDMMMTAYIRVLSRKVGRERIVMPCPVDLRRYLSPKRPHGICNLTSNYICDVRAGGSFEDTLTQVKEQMHAQKSADDCLKPVMLLELLFHLLPFGAARKIFPKTFKIPVLSYTNFGILDRDRLCFDKAAVTGGFLTGAIKSVPSFQVAVSTLGGEATLSCNLYGTLQDENEIADLLEKMCRELNV